MNIYKHIKKILSDACIYFTAAEFVLLLIATGFSEMSPEAGGEAAMFLSIGSTALIFVACLIMSSLNLIFKAELSSSLRLLIHFIGSLIAYSVVFIIIPGAWRDFTAIFVRLGVFVILYLIIALVAMIIKSIKAGRRADKLEYESQFGEFFSHKK
ncbi:MAG: DUF3021 family protein [Clostridiales bacterium]|nr:DUF3021 family protein [Clostridiales bacterium]